MANMLREIADTLDRLDGWTAFAFYFFAFVVLLCLIALVVLFFIERADLKKRIAIKENELHKLERKIKEACNTVEYYKELDFERNVRR